MRLSEISYIISNLSIKNSIIITSSANQLNTTLGNLIRAKKLIKEIEDNDIDFFKEEIDFIKKSGIYKTDLGETPIDKNIATKIQDNSKFIYDSLNSLNIVLNRITPKKNENSFLIKLPKPNSFEELTKDMSKIQKQLQLIVSDKKIDSSIEINNWEYGSYWIDLLVNTGTALSVLASITHSAAYMVKVIRKDKEHQLYIERLEISNESLKDMQEGLKKHIDGLYDIEVLNIQKEYFDNEVEPERTKKIKDTIKLFAEIINRGGEFQPSLIAPEKMKKNFPDLKNIENIKSKVKRIAGETESGHEE